MPVISLSTFICAPIERCFDLSRSIDLHMISTAQTGERAIAGRTGGLIGSGETVTWRARHFGIWQTLTSRITVCERPYLFSDEMVRGAFHSFSHEHRFSEMEGGTLMEDVFTYKSPLGILGRIADAWFLQSYMTGLLEKRNADIRAYGETEKWRAVLPA